jgi:hypothetical protein
MLFYSSMFRRLVGDPIQKEASQAYRGRKSKCSGQDSQMLHSKRIILASGLWIDT